MAQNNSFRRMDHSSQDETEDLKPEEIKLLSQISVQVGRRIASGNYRGTIESITHEGEFITNTRSHKSGEKVAIKWLRFSQQESPMVWSELEALTDIKHPNIVDIQTAVLSEIRYWFSLKQFTVAIVMELATYGSLATWIKMVDKGECQMMNLDQFKKFANGLADAVTTLHRTGRSNRCLHTENVFIFEDHSKDGGVIPKLLTVFGSEKTDKEQDVRNVQECDRKFFCDLLEVVGSVAVKAEKRKDVEQVLKVRRGFVWKEASESSESVWRRIVGDSTKSD